jgi:hypothetical protein
VDSSNHGPMLVLSQEGRRHAQTNRVKPRLLGLTPRLV